MLDVICTVYVSTLLLVLIRLHLPFTIRTGGLLL